MNLTVSSLIIFLLLIPGMVFRSAVFFDSTIKRPFAAGNSLFISIAIVFFSLMAHIFSIFAFSIFVFFYNLIVDEVVISVRDFNSSIYIFKNHIRHSIINFIAENKLISLSYGSLVIALSIGAAFAFKKAAYKVKLFGRLLYGPLSPLIKSKNFDFLTCFVMTKVQHDRKIMIYAGYVAEVTLRDGNNIDHIVIEDPQKFYVKLNDRYPTTNYANSRQIASGLSDSGFMYISGAEIENVHFESWSFKQSKS